MASRLAPLRTRFSRISLLAALLIPASFALPTPTAHAQGAPDDTMQQPVAGFVITSRFAVARNVGSRVHVGTDFALPAGSTVRPMARGRVILEGWTRCEYIVQVDHGGGVRTRYVHLQSVNVATSATVLQSSILGTSGAARPGSRSVQSGCATGPHLHVELYSPRPSRNGRRMGNKADAYDAIGMRVSQLAGRTPTGNEAVYDETGVGSARGQAGSEGGYGAPAAAPAGCDASTDPVAGCDPDVWRAICQSSRLQVEQSAAVTAQIITGGGGSAGAASPSGGATATGVGATASSLAIPASLGGGISGLLNGGGAPESVFGLSCFDDIINDIKTVRNTIRMLSSFNLTAILNNIIQSVIEAAENAFKNFVCNAAKSAFDQVIGKVTKPINDALGSDAMAILNQAGVSINGSIGGTTFSRPAVPPALPSSITSIGTMFP